MEALFASGRIIDLILLLVVLEAAVLAAFPRLRGAMTMVDVAALLAPGVMLMLAVRAALSGAPHTITAAVLAAAFAFHILDVTRRRRKRDA
jgi:ABC-type amino acid transport system permease subunit